MQRSRAVAHGESQVQSAVSSRMLREERRDGAVIPGLIHESGYAFVVSSGHRLRWHALGLGQFRLNENTQSIEGRSVKRRVSVASGFTHYVSARCG